MNQILHGDSLEVLKTVADESVDVLVTDPPYGYSFMGKDWDKAVPSVDIWRECLRVLKPGGWCMVMSAPRSDVQNAMISRLMEAGFRLDFTPIYWTYASGFPKAGNVGKLVDKRLGAVREVVGTKVGLPGYSDTGETQASGYEGGFKDPKKEVAITAPATDQAKALDGSYTGFQPKPAVEVIIVAMKPLSEKTYVDQALANGKGVTWLDDCRVPSELPEGRTRHGGGIVGAGTSYELPDSHGEMPSGRFPANLLVSDDVLNDGRVIKSNGGGTSSTGFWAEDGRRQPIATGDSGSYSRYFSLDAWAQTLPFLIVPKASKREKNEGLEGFTDVNAAWKDETRLNKHATRQPTKNGHPTVKPLKLMSYLITLGSRPGDVVLDPFLGSGTTAIAAKQLGRNYIGIEREWEYVEIAEARLDAIPNSLFNQEESSLAVDNSLVKK